MLENECIRRVVLVACCCTLRQKDIMFRVEQWIKVEVKNYPRIRSYENAYFYTISLKFVLTKVFSPFILVFVRKFWHILWLLDILPKGTQN